jgi:hypothetical protein
MRRSKDPLWIGPTVIIVLGFGSIASLGFESPNARMDPTDGLCHLGLPNFVTIPLMSFDIVTNVLLTVLFVYLLGPVMRMNDFSNSNRIMRRLANAANTCCVSARKRNIGGPNLGNPRVAKRIEKLLWRTFAGSCLVLMPTVANMSQLIYFNGQERGLICLSVCNVDGMLLPTWREAILIF